MRTNLSEKEIFLWNIQLYTIKCLASFPHPRAIASSYADSTIYRNPGINRQSEKNTYVFQYTLRGHGELQVKDTVYDIGKNQGFLVELSDPDICYYFPGKCHTPWVFLFFVFENTNNQVKTINSEYGYVFDLDINSSLIKRLLKFQNIKKKVLEMSVGEGTMLVNSVLCTLVDAARAPMVDNKNIQIIRQVHKLIEQNINIPYNASMLADDIQISQEHLSRIFKRETQTSPYKLITRFKIREACTLLKESSMTSKEIALKVGYEPGSHFARIFKRETGLTPLNFRTKGVMPF